MKKVLSVTLTALSIMTSQAVGAQQRTNAFLVPSTAPHEAVEFNKIAYEDYEDAILKGIKQQEDEIDAITSNPQAPDFYNTIVALEHSGRLLGSVTLALGNLESALGDTTLMNITTKMTPVMAQHSTNIMLNPRLWERVKAVYDNRNSIPNLTPEDMRLLEETYKDFAESGAMLKGNDREKYRKLNAELSDLYVRFSQNVTNDMKNPANTLWLTIDQLEGLPQSFIDAARAEAKETLEAKGEKDDGTKYLFTVFYPSYNPFMKYIKNRNLREQMYRLYNSRNSKGEFDNTQILKDIANVRLEIANLFGKKDYAEYALERRMAKNAANVYNLLDQLRDAYTPALKVELEEIENFARQTEGADFKLQAWDYAYWANKLKNAKYSFNDEDMRPYFELNNTIKGVFGLAGKLYGYKFTENKNIPGYHPDVKAFDVTDRNGNFIGVIYTDFYYRAGKSPGAWMTEFRGERIDDNGKKFYPLVSIVMNFTKPTGNNPVLLSSGEVETFLHEFGHALHGLSANTRYGSLSGTNVYRDFVELFSQFNENYLTEKEFLDSFAKHYKTNKKMPQELINKFVKSSQFGAAYACMRQLGFGYLDMAYHTIKEPLRASENVATFEAKSQEHVKIFDQVEGTLTSPSFGHIFSGGYAAGYYGYKWCEVLDADAFAEFKEHGIFDRKTSDRFLKMLQSGGTVDPNELYVGFRGHEPTIDALLKRDGIKK